MTMRLTWPSAKGIFTVMKILTTCGCRSIRNTPEARDCTFTGLENPRPETKAASQPRVDPLKLPFDPKEFIKTLPSWEGVEFDRAA